MSNTKVHQTCCNSVREINVETRNVATSNYLGSYGGNNLGPKPWTFIWVRWRGWPNPRESDKHDLHGRRL